MNMKLRATMLVLPVAVSTTTAVIIFSVYKLRRPHQEIAGYHYRSLRYHA